MAMDHTANMDNTDRRGVIFLTRSILSAGVRNAITMLSQYHKSYSIRSAVVAQLGKSAEIQIGISSGLICH